MGSNPVIGTLVRGDHLDAGTQGEHQVTRKAEAGPMQLQAEGYQGMPEAGRGEEGSSPTASETAGPRRHLDSGVLATRPWENKFLLFYASVCSFVMAALGITNTRI